MFESKTEIASLQKLLDRSIDGAGSHLLEIIKPISASKMCKRLSGVKQAAWTTVSSKSEPRVAPVDFVFIHGRFYLSTDLNSLRAKHLKRNPATSVTYFEDISFSVMVHGTGEIVRQNGKYYALARGLFVKHYGRKLIDSIPGIIFVRINPKLMFTHMIK